MIGITRSGSARQDQRFYQGATRTASPMFPSSTIRKPAARHESPSIDCRITPPGRLRQAGHLTRQLGAQREVKRFPARVRNLAPSLLQNHSRDMGQGGGDGFARSGSIRRDLSVSRRRVEPHIPYSRRPRANEQAIEKIGLIRGILNVTEQRSSDFERQDRFLGQVLLSTSEAGAVSPKGVPLPPKPPPGGDFTRRVCSLRDFAVSPK